METKISGGEAERECKSSMDCVKSSSIRINKHYNARKQLCSTKKPYHAYTDGINRSYNAKNRKMPIKTGGQP